MKISMIEGEGGGFPVPDRMALTSCPENGKKWSHHSAPIHQDGKRPSKLSFEKKVKVTHKGAFYG